jgi:outer membrane usher protein FimD/PapC
MGKAFPVSYDGVTYVTGFDHGAAGSAQWGESRCSFRLEPPPANDPLPDMGSVDCRAEASAQP